MNSQIGLKEGTAKRFEEWFRSVAKAAVHIEVIEKEMVSTFKGKLGHGGPLVYELAGEHTLSGKPERFRVERDELSGVQS